MKKNIWRALAVAGGLGLIWVVVTSRFFTTNVRYILRRRDGRFEIREYPDLAVAETVSADDSSAFDRLFRYIQRGNSTAQKISMTAPVLLQKNENGRTMSFVIPDDILAPPEPHDGNVLINARPAACYAALLYRGGKGARQERQAVAILRRWLIDQQLPAAGDPIIAYYDPPWMPPPLRRNEVLIPLPKQP